MESTFLCLLPTQEDSAQLCKNLGEIFFLDAFPFIKLPLHLTLYYFPTPTYQSNAKAMNWLRTSTQKNKGPIHANTMNVGCFKKNNHDFVYYLPAISERFDNFHEELSTMFQDVHTDPFAFVPHLSLFYPQRDLNEDEKKRVKSIFRDFNTISFDTLAFAAEKNGGIHYLATQSL